MLPAASGQKRPFTRAQSYHRIRKFLAATADNRLRRVATISRSIGPSHINSRIALLWLRTGFVPQIVGCDSREHVQSGLEVIELAAQGLLVNPCGNPSTRQLNWELGAISHRTRTDSYYCRRRASFSKTGPERTVLLPEPASRCQRRGADRIVADVARLLKSGIVGQHELLR